VSSKDFLLNNKSEKIPSEIFLNLKRKRVFWGIRTKRFSPETN